MKSEKKYEKLTISRMIYYKTYEDIFFKIETITSEDWLAVKYDSNNEKTVTVDADGILHSNIEYIISTSKI